MKALKIKKSAHTKPKSKTSRVEKIPFYIFMSSVAFILVALVLVYLVDLRNVFGSRDFLISSFPQRPFLFHHLFSEAKLIELFQWLLLGGTALVSMFISGLMYNKDRNAFLFWAVMAAAFTLMLIEDAGNPRHIIRLYVESIFSDPLGLAGMASEAIYFTILASIPIYALLHYRIPAMKDFRAARYLITGFIGYAMAAFLSFTGSRVPISDEALYIYILSTRQ